MQKCIGSVEAYQADSSPKINRLLELIQHHRGEERADAPILYWNRDGERIEGPQPKTAASPTKSKKSRRRKFVVYCHLSQSWKLVTHVTIYYLKCYMCSTNKLTVQHYRFSNYTVLKRFRLTAQWRLVNETRLSSDFRVTTDQT